MTRALAAIACLLIPYAALAQTPDGHRPNEAMAHHQDGSALSEPGQAAFAAIQEIVEILEADPATDWSKVKIDALREHLVDMDNVTLKSIVTGEQIEDGVRFQITGRGPVQESIRRMVAAHASAMDGVDGWHFNASEISEGTELTVLPTAADRAMLRGLGFFGVMARGMHHQEHHLMLARGQAPHE
ncbi:hypothetical protein [Mesorhizobium sp. M00.F.Ca.ET.216.01.1.1]|uniref:hypothetical protein n=1 Tax=Mesorhizobium sp. M00.F.Ca.ET.216.01.1.1 TaxID=2500528 RepID=UPI000FD74974|nr:hypothetical protein [Mesorhizobium sp. M00.F.Ca.ET.216.01.1.1]TGQ30428.1 hypothetical protein EN859_031975 [Mesorhizobium sp. M00.F.Ca.ET.216.01.1.1]